MGSVRGARTGRSWAMYSNSFIGERYSLEWGTTHASIARRAAGMAEWGIGPATVETDAEGARLGFKGGLQGAFADEDEE